jgi:hypothetical protein
MPAFSIQAGKQMRMNLKVPFAEKDEAKKLGAKWDSAQKIWYVEGKADMSPFSKWSATPQDSTDGGAVAQKSTPANKQAAVGMVIVGSEYVKQPRICDCLPWDVCDNCQATALSN